MTARTARILFLPREAFPTDRVRINVLFGREMRARGHEIHLVMQAANADVPVGERAWPGGALSIGRTDKRDGVLHRVRKQLLALGHDISALRSCSGSRYDVVLISDKFISAVLASCMARRRGVRFLFWLTFPYPEADLLSARNGTARFPWVAHVRGRIYGWLLYKWILPRADGIFVQSDRMRGDIAAHGIPVEKMWPILTGFDLVDIQPVRKATDPQAGQRVTLGYLGTLSANRHLEVLVDMLSSLRKGGMDARLLLVGDAERPRDRALLERHAQSRDVLEYVEITGFLPQPAALRRLAEADACLSPFPPTPVMLASSPTKLIEYMAMGLPVVASDHPEQRSILRESRAGVRVPWGAQHFARAVRWIMSRSPAERAAMGVRGRAWVESHRTYVRIAEGVERVCLAVMDK